jgi:hypothetical protein
MAQQINFSDRFNENGNQCYIALGGKPEEMINRLEMIIQDIKQHGKPIQMNVVTFGLDCQVITPIWNGKPC